MKPITLTFDAFKDLMVNDVALREEITHKRYYRPR